MPLYEYKCDDCGKVFEVIQKFADEPLKIHADCGGAVERLISAPAFHLKGSGWYVTDYGKGNAGVKPSSDANAASDAKAGKNEKKTDSGSSTSSSAETKTSESKPTESKPAASESKSSGTATTSDSK